MRILNNETAFNELVSTKVKDGMREQLKKLCTKHIHTNDNYAMVNGMTVASEFTSPEMGFDLAVVIINQGLLIFSLKEKTLEQWTEEVRVLNKKEIPTPHKVIIKMIGLRLMKIRNYYDKEVLSRQRDNKYTSRAPLPVFPDLNSKQAIIDFSVLVKKTGHLGHCNQWFNELTDLFNRPGVDDGMIHEAWCLVVAREIMES